MTPIIVIIVAVATAVWVFHLTTEARMSLTANSRAMQAYEEALDELQKIRRQLDRIDPETIAYETRARLASVSEFLERAKT